MRKLYAFLMMTLDGFHEGPNEEITWLKQQPGKDLAILGSSNLTVSLLGMGLVDVLGDGKSLFRSTKEELKLQLLQSRTFSSGNVLLTY